MAYITNPLDEFQSHSIHYVVLASRSTEDIYTLTEDSPQSLVESLRAIDSVSHIGEQVPLASASSAYLLLDTRRFSQFMIENFEIETAMTGFAIPGSKSPTSTALNAKFTVIDSAGISFANFLQYIMDEKLQVSFDGMTILVRVLFIGHKADGRSEVVQSLSIPAMFKSIQVNLNEVKGIYDCTLIPLIGVPSNAANNAKWTNIGTASTYFTGASENTLGAVVNSFERRLNEISLDRFTSKNAETQTNGKRQAVGRYGRPVQYMITLPKGWAEMQFSGPSQGAALETVFKKEEKIRADSNSAVQAQKKAQSNSAAPAKDSFVAVDPNLTITEVLDTIFSQTLAVSKLANFTRAADQDGTIKFYKHLITITSDDNSFTVHVDVVEFVVPNVDLQSSTNAINNSDQDLYTQEVQRDGTMKRVPKQFVEYDYIFSGTNIDVLSLDLKIENLNILLMQGVKLGQGQIFETANDGQVQTDGAAPADDKGPVYGRRQKDPVLIPQRTKDERTNFSNLAANAQTDGSASPQAIAQQYTRNLSAFYNAGPVDAKLELRGNPDLMIMVSLQAMPKHVSALTISSDGKLSDSDVSVKTKYRTDFEKNLIKINGINSDDPGAPINSRMLTGRNFVSSPFFMKVNVFGPNVDFKTNEPIPGDYTARLFFDNFYLVDRVVSKIEHSKFTQEVALRSFSVYSWPTAVTQGAETSTVKEVNARDRR